MSTNVPGLHGVSHSNSPRMSGFLSGRAPGLLPREDKIYGGRVFSSVSDGASFHLSHGAGPASLPVPAFYPGKRRSQSRNQTPHKYPRRQTQGINPTQVSLEEGSGTGTWICWLREALGKEVRGLSSSLGFLYGSSESTLASQLRLQKARIPIRHSPSVLNA